MGSSPKPPTPPDPTQTANAQWDYTRRAGDYTAGRNAQNLYTPFGSVTYQRDASGAPIGQTVSLNEGDQRILDNQRNVGFGLGNAALAQLQNMPQDRFRLDQMRTAMPGTDDYQGWGDKIARNSYEQRLALMRPDIEQGRTRLDQRIADQGLPAAGEAGSSLTGNYERGVGQLYNQAAGGALADAGNEMSRLQGLQTSAYQNELNSRLTERSLPFNELAQYLQATPQSPYQSAQGVQPVNYMPSDYAGAVNQNYQGQLANYQAKLQNNAAKWQAVGDIVGSAGKAFAMSDRTAKTDIQPVDHADVLSALKTLPNYTYRYKANAGDGGREQRIGPMAQDWADRFGGNGEVIPMPQMLGALLVAVQALTVKVEALEARVA
jgi:hypothetical protein